MAALTKAKALGIFPSTSVLPTPIWVAAGILGLAGGGLVLLFADSIVERLVWLAQNYRAVSLSLSADQVEEVRLGVDIWAWSGIIMGALALLLSHPYLRSLLFKAALWRPTHANSLFSLAPDRYDFSFFLATGSVLVFTALSHWSLTAYKDVDWFGGEDGVSEWWSVATYIAAALFSGAAAWRLRSAGHPGLALFQSALAVLLLVGALEEISWGQRLFDWSTPQALEAINEQGETTIHNVERLDSAIYSLFFWGSVVALVGGAVRAARHLAGRVTNTDFILPSLVIAPALLMIIVWRVGDSWTAVNLPRLIMEAFDYGPQGSEVPEVLLGLCLLVYTYSSFKRSRMLSKPENAARSENAAK